MYANHVGQFTNLTPPTMKYFLGLSLALLFTLAFSACDGFTPESSATDAAAKHEATKFVLELGETAKLSGGASLTFEEVLSDNRCPVGVLCVERGEARVLFTFKSADGTRDRIVASIPGGSPGEIPIESAQTFAIGHLSLRLLSLQPYPGEPALDFLSPVTAMVYLEQR